MAEEKRTRTTSTLLGAQLRLGDEAALKRVLDAYWKTGGNEYKAAEILDVPRRTLINWKNAVPALAEGVAEIRSAAEDGDEG